MPDACGRWVPAAGPLPLPATVTMPGDWSATLGTDFAGAVALERRFSAPRGLEPTQRVWLVFEEVEVLGEVTLNGQGLGTIVASMFPALETSWQRCPARFDVTEHLRFRNHLEVVVHCPVIGPDGFPVPRPGWEQQPGGLVGLVQLEITSPERGCAGQAVATASWPAPADPSVPSAGNLSLHPRQ